jgi:hypothetical protein
MTGASAQQPPVQPPALPAAAEAIRPAPSPAEPGDHLTAAASGRHFRHLPAAGNAGRTGIARITDACHALPDAPAR